MNPTSFRQDFRGRPILKQRRHHFDQRPHGLARHCFSEADELGIAPDAGTPAARFALDGDHHRYAVHRGLHGRRTHPDENFASCVQRRQLLIEQRTQEVDQAGGVRFGSTSPPSAGRARPSVHRRPRVASAGNGAGAWPRFAPRPRSWCPKAPSPARRAEFRSTQCAPEVPSVSADLSRTRRAGDSLPPGQKDRPIFRPRGRFSASRDNERTHPRTGPDLVTGIDHHLLPFPQTLDDLGLHAVGASRLHNP